MVRSSRQTRNKPGRKPLTKEMLLPLPAVKVRALSLANHLLLAAIHSGHGNLDVVKNLIRVLYLAYFMLDGAQGQRDLDVFRNADAVLEHTTARAEQAQGWTLTEEDHGVLERLLAFHDQQLGTIPSYRYLEAWDRLERFVRSDAPSPITA
ncbi:hypothetical protein R75461_07223 [Paraburkholderia nemoris]|nr:hypothetical protein R75461_07223 [Paraburkholderia nemoris]